MNERGAAHFRRIEWRFLGAPQVTKGENDSFKGAFGGTMNLAVRLKSDLIVPRSRRIFPLEKNHADPLKDVIRAPHIRAP
jgi:hypothetical protein